MGGESIITREEPELKEQEEGAEGRWDLDYALCMAQQILNFPCTGSGLGQTEWPQGCKHLSCASLAL